VVFKRLDAVQRELFISFLVFGGKVMKSFALMMSVGVTALALSLSSAGEAQAWFGRHGSGGSNGSSGGYFSGGSNGGSGSHGGLFGGLFGRRNGSHGSSGGSYSDCGCNNGGNDECSSCNTGCGCGGSTEVYQGDDQSQGGPPTAPRDPGNAPQAPAGEHAAGQGGGGASASVPAPAVEGERIVAVNTQPAVRPMRLFRR